MGVVLCATLADAQTIMNIDVAAQCSTFAGTARLWGTINAASFGPEAAIRDWNRNGRVDMILTRTNEPPIYRTEVYEYEGVDSSGHARFSIPYQLPLFVSPSCSPYPCPPYVLAQGDIDQNGLFELITQVSYDTMRVFEQPDTFSFPTVQRFRLRSAGPYITEGQVRRFDATAESKLLINLQISHSLFRSVSRDTFLTIAWRDSSLTNGNSTVNYGRYAVGDFDNDGRMEFAGGNEYPDGPGHSYDAFMFVYENTGPNTFRRVVSDTIPGVINLFIHGSGGDLDGNGKPEFWLGGYMYTARTFHKFYMYEATSDNHYDSAVVVNLLLPYLGTAAVGSIAFGDVDGDNLREIALCTGDYVVLLKPVAEHQFRIISCFAIPTAQAEVTLVDIDRDGRAEIVVSSWYAFATWLYKYSPPTFAPFEREARLNETALLSAYPNPFNPSTRISYSIPRRMRCNLGLYNLLGQRLFTLFEGIEEKGTHSREFDANVLNLASGTYVVRLEAGGTVRASKIVLVR
jgi:hypothetical protein